MGRRVLGTEAAEVSYDIVARLSTQCNKAQGISTGISTVGSKGEDGKGSSVESLKRI